MNMAEKNFAALLRTGECSTPPLCLLNVRQKFQHCIIPFCTATCTGAIPGYSLGYSRLFFDQIASVFPLRFSGHRPHRCRWQLNHIPMTVGAVEDGGSGFRWFILYEVDIHAFLRFICWLVHLGFLIGCFY